ncbi:MAG: putative Ig domain-containing protein [Rhodobacteraceae bacterium]|nr:putative Ig domain-containing protein [Paracoccaceae bacterium]
MRVADVARTGPLAAGDTRVETITAELPLGVAGALFLVVQVNSDGALLEGGGLGGNNIASRAIAVADTDYPDLSIVSFSSPAELRGTFFQGVFGWEVRNDGIADSRATAWHDELWLISATGQETLLGRFARDGVLAAGEAYARSEEISFAVNDGVYTVELRVDTGGAVFQGAGAVPVVEARQIVLSRGPHADLAVRDVTADLDTVTAGQTLRVQWVVENVGSLSTAEALFSPGRIVDRVRLVPLVPGTGGGLLPGSTSGPAKARVAPLVLGPGGSYVATLEFEVPVFASPALYRIEVETNADKGVYELFRDNNVAAGPEVTVTAADLPDLRVDALELPPLLVEGEVLDIAWRLSNVGAATTFYPFREVVRFVPNPGSGFSSSVLAEIVSEHGGALAPGQERLRSIRIDSATVAGIAQGGTIEVEVTGIPNQIFVEPPGGRDDNKIAGVLLVEALARPDLEVTAITAPANVKAGDTVTLTFTVENIGDVPADGRWTDRVLLSASPDASLVIPDAIRLDNPSALASGESYVSDPIEIVLPITAAGQLWLIVEANWGPSASGRPLDENLAVSNNRLAIPIEVEPAPLADLVVSDVRAPDQVLAGATATVSYTVSNLGEAATRNAAQVEQIWLTRDRTRPRPAASAGDLLLSTTTRTTGLMGPGAGYDVTTQVVIPDYLETGRWFITPWVDPFGAEPERTFSQNVNPDDPATPDSNNFKAGGGVTGEVIVIGRPAPVLRADVAAVSVSAAEVPGTDGVEWDFTLSFENRGQTTLREGEWGWFLDISDSPAGTGETYNFDFWTAQERSMNAPELRPGESYTETRRMMVGPHVKGSYVTLRAVAPGDADRDNDIAYLDERFDDLFTDLVVTDLTLPDGPLTIGESVEFSYTVTNLSPRDLWPGTRRVIDQFWLSAGPGDDMLRALGFERVELPGGLAAGESYTRTVTIDIPTNVTPGDYRIHVRANNPQVNVRQNGSYPDSNYFEISSTGFGGGLGFNFVNRAYDDWRSGNIFGERVTLVADFPDLVIERFDAPASIVAGEVFEVEIEVRNNGSATARTPEGWLDRLFLSRSGSIEPGSHLLLHPDPLELRIPQGTLRTAALAPGESYVTTIRARVHHTFEGDFTLIAMTDAGNYIGVTPQPGIREGSVRASSASHDVKEGPGEGNNTAARAITVVPAARPELIITELSLPDRIVAGEDVRLTYTIANEGADLSDPTQRIALELAFAPAGGDPGAGIEATLPRQQIMLDAIPGGGSVSGEIVFRVPVSVVPDVYVLRMRVDPPLRGPFGEILETPRGEAEGARFVPVTIELPPPADLLPGNVLAPTAMVPGERATITWTVRNDSDVTVSGPWTDVLYLSRDATLDVSDVVMGRLEYNVTLAPGEEAQLSLNVDVPPVQEGPWRVLVRTDVFNEVYEGAGVANNVAAAALLSSVTVPALPIGTDVALSLAPGQQRLYRIDAPLGQTLEVRATAGASGAAPALFMAQDRAATRSDFDLSDFAIPGAAARVVVPGTTPGAYYLLVRAGDTPVSTTLRASLLPLAISGVSVERVGAGAFVTATITGAQFDAGAIPRLSRPGATAFEPVAWQVLDSTRIVATFDLTGAPLGLYDVSVTNRSGARVTLPYRVMVEPPQSPEVGVAINGPRVVTTTDILVDFPILVRNAANIDAPYVHFQTWQADFDINLIIARETPEGELTRGWRNWSSVGLRGAPGAGNATLFAELDPTMEIGRRTIATGYVFDLAPGQSAATTLVEHVYPRTVFNTLSDEELASLPFNGWVGVSATPLTRAEFVAHQSDIARGLRRAILDDSTAGPSLLALAADEALWVRLYLAGLEEAGVLRPEANVPAVREAPLIASLLSQIGASVTLGPLGSAVQASGGAPAFFDRLVNLYRDAPPLRDALILPTETTVDYNSNAMPQPGMAALGMSAPTAFMTRDYLMRLPDVIEGQGSGLSDEMLRALGPAGLGRGALSAFSLREYLRTEGLSDGSALMTGPRVADTGGFVPLGRDLPYTIGLVNEDPFDHVRELRVAVEIDRDLDAGSFALGDLRLGDIEIPVPAGSWGYQRDFDFTESRGFILRVSAAINVFDRPETATWLIQAIDPETGDVIRDPNRGFLAPGATAEMGYTLRLAPADLSGAPVSAEARILIDDRPDIAARAPEVRADARLPSSTLAVTDLGGGVHELLWQGTDDMALSHVSLYVAEDGGSFRLIAPRLEGGSDAFLFEGEAGKTYRFASLATDLAGNREVPQGGARLPADGPAPDLGAPARVEGATAETPLVRVPVEIPLNPLFAWALSGARSPYVSPGAPTEFGRVGDPFVAEGFATGIPGSGAGLGPLALAEAPDGTVLIVGGATRNALWRMEPEGGPANDPLRFLDFPVYDLAFDAAGRLWAATGGGPLLQLDPVSGEIIGRFGDEMGLAIAPDPSGEALYVAGIEGLYRFDIATGSFTLISRDLDLRLGSLAVGPDGAVWGITWPDRNRVVRLGESGRVETVAQSSAQLDSIAFGAPGTALENLAIISANDAGDGSGGALYLLEPASGRFALIAGQGTRADAVIATADGRILVSKSGQVDLVVPVRAPEVVEITPEEGAVALAPLPFVQVTFDQPMYLGATDEPGSVLNPAHFVLRNESGDITRPDFVVWDAASRTAFLGLSGLPVGGWTLEIAPALLSAYRVPLGEEVTHGFEIAADLSALIDIEILNTRFDRASGLVSYDVRVTNVSERELRLPFLLALGGEATGGRLPLDIDGVSGDGRFLIDLSGNLAEGGRLAPGASTTASTVRLAATERRTSDFVLGVVGGHGDNVAPIVISQPPLEAALGEVWRYEVISFDEDGDRVFHALRNAPDGMTIDPLSGLIEWTPGPGAKAATEVVVHVFDTLGAGSLQRFTIAVENGNSAPVFGPAPTDMIVREGDLLELELRAVDPDGDRVILLADGLPPGATFDAATGTLRWVPAAGQAGLYTDLRITATDGQAETRLSLPIRVLGARPAPVLDAPAERSVREGERIVIRLSAEGAPGAQLRFGVGGDGLPTGASLDAETGIFSWTPGFDQADTYNLLFTVSDGETVTARRSTITVTPENGAPIFLGLDGWAALTGEEIVIPLSVIDPDNPRYRPPQRGADGELVERAGNPAPSMVVTPVSGLPEGAVFDPDTWELRWTPRPDQWGRFDIVLAATDDGAGTGVPITTEATLSIEVRAQNAPPVIEPVPALELDEGEGLSVTLRATDPEGGPVTLALENALGLRLPDFVAFADNGDGTGTLTLAPGTGARGLYGLRLVARDAGTPGGDGADAAEARLSFALTVTPVNAPPLVDDLPDALAILGSEMVLPVGILDLDGDVLEIVLEGLPGAVVEETSTPGLFRIRWTPMPEDLGTRTATLTVQEEGADPARAVTRSFQVTTRTSNAAPVLSYPGAQEVAAGSTLELTLQGFDLDGDTLRYGARNLPRGATLDSATGVFRWTPDRLQGGTREIVFTVSDGAATVEMMVPVTVTVPNSAPVFSPLPDRIARESGLLEVALNVIDPEGHLFRLDIIEAPETAFLTSTPLADERLLVWRPDFGDAGLHRFTLRAIDEKGAESTISFEVEVRAVNRPPAVTLPPLQAVVGEEFRHQVNATDPDGDVLAFALEDAPEGMVIDPASGEIVWTPLPGQAGDAGFVLRVDDGTVTRRLAGVVGVARAPLAPELRLEFTPAFPALPGQPVAIRPVISGATLVSLSVAGTELTPGPTGAATFTPATPGRLDVVLVAEAPDGTRHTLTEALRVRDPADREAPVLDLDELPDGGRITAPTEVRGTVLDANLDFWRVTLAPRGAAPGAEVVLGAGTGPISGVLATLDPGLMADGFYTLRVEARDIGGRRVLREAAVEIAQPDKPARLMLAETDALVNLDGFALEMVRQYDSFAPGTGQRGSLGAGWSFAGIDLDLRSELDGVVSSAFGLFPPLRLGTGVNLALPDGGRATFSFVPEVTEHAGMRYITPAWVSDDAPGWRLETPMALLRDANGRYFDASSGAPYNPAAHGEGTNYILTAADGRFWGIDSTRGVTRMGDGAGNVVNVTSTGLTGRDGTRVDFERDSHGMIRAVHLPDGTSLRYLRDASGQLVLARGAGDEGSRYGYDAAGLLTHSVTPGAGGTTGIAARACPRPVPSPPIWAGCAIWPGAPPRGPSRRTVPVWPRSSCPERSPAPPRAACSCGWT